MVAGQAEEIVVGETVPTETRPEDGLLVGPTPLCVKGGVDSGVCMSTGHSERLLGSVTSTREDSETGLLEGTTVYSK